MGCNKIKKHHMKFIATALLLFVTSFLSFSNDSYLVKSQIKKVIVYQQGAQINRQGRYIVSKGITEIKIQGVSPFIDPNTMQIKASGNVVILDSKHTINYPEPSTQNTGQQTIPPKIKHEIKLLEDSLFDLSFEEQNIKDQLNVLLKEKQIIEGNGAVNGTGKANDSIPLLQEALVFYHKRVNEINGIILKLNRAQTLLTRKRERMNQRLTTLNNYNRNNQFNPPTPPEPIHEISITLSANETTSGKISVSYLVNNAGWIPLYDLRSNNNRKTIDLTYKAQVYQNTGIDWNQVPLNLSTNNPYENKTKPNLNPWYLDYSSNYTRTNVNKGYKKNLEQPTLTTNYESKNYTDEVTESEEADDFSALDAEAFVSSIQQLVSVEYAIDLPYTIKSDNEKNMVLVKKSQLKTNYRYYAIPKLDLSVYLIAQITNLGELNLIPGKATIFHDGSYLGNTYLNPSSMSDTMDLSLGKTSNIIVKRTLMKNNCKERIIGEKIVRTFAYQIEIKNKNQQAIQLTIEDQLPVSRNNEIEVEIEDLSKGQLNKINGLIRWHNKIKANGSHTLELIYTIKYEKNKPINLAVN